MTVTTRSSRKRALVEEIYILHRHLTLFIGKHVPRAIFVDLEPTVVGRHKQITGEYIYKMCTNI
jgi:hypothetical protein